MADVAESCRADAAKMPDRDLVDAITVLGPDSPLLPAVRAELVHRLETRAATDTKETP